MILKPKQLVKALHAAYKAKKAVLVLGPPGVGKTAIAMQFAVEVNRPLAYERLTDMQSTDLRGIPFPLGQEGVCRFLPLEMIAKLAKEPHVFVMDELPQADPSVQKAAACILRELLAGSTRLHPETFCIAAGNRMEDKAGANKLLSHLADRVCILELEFSAEDWANWAVKADLDEYVIAFGLNPSSAAVMQFRPEQVKNCTPRGLEDVSKILRAKPDKEVEIPLIAGIIGEAAATAFVNFRRIAEKCPSLQEVRRSPKQADLPTEPGARYSMAVACAMDAEEKYFAHYLAYLGRMGGEFQRLCCDLALEKEPNLKESAAYAAHVATQKTKV